MSFELGNVDKVLSFLIGSNSIQNENSNTSKTSVVSHSALKEGNHNNIHESPSKSTKNMARTPLGEIKNFSNFSHHTSIDTISPIKSHCKSKSKSPTKKKKADTNKVDRIDIEKIVDPNSKKNRILDGTLLLRKAQLLKQKRQADDDAMNRIHSHPSPSSQSQIAPIVSSPTRESESINRNQVDDIQQLHEKIHSLQHHLKSSNGQVTLLKYTIEKMKRNQNIHGNAYTDSTTNDNTEPQVAVGMARRALTEGNQSSHISGVNDENATEGPLSTLFDASIVLENANVSLQVDLDKREIEIDHHVIQYDVSDWLVFHVRHQKVLAELLAGVVNVGVNQSILSVNGQETNADAASKLEDRGSASENIEPHTPAILSKCLASDEYDQISNSCGHSKGIVWSSNVDVGDIETPLLKRLLSPKPQPLVESNSKPPTVPQMIVHKAQEVSAPDFDVVTQTSGPGTPRDRTPTTFSGGEKTAQSTNKSTRRSNSKRSNHRQRDCVHLRYQHLPEPDIDLSVKTKVSISSPLKVDAQATPRTIRSAWKSWTLQADMEEKHRQDPYITENIAPLQLKRQQYSDALVIDPTSDGINSLSMTGMIQGSGRVLELENPYNKIVYKTSSGQTKHILSPATFKTYLSQMKDENDAMVHDVAKFKQNIKVRPRDICIILEMYVVE